MRVDATPVRAGVPDRSVRLVARWILVSLALLAVVTALVGLAFAGSSARIAEGVHIAGVDVGGLTPKEAQALLESRFERVARVPIVFTAGGEEYPIKATTLGVEADWATAIDSAAREGEGFGPVRGFKRLQTRFFGSEIAPPVQVYEAALDFKLATLAREIDRRHVEAKLVRRGLSVEIVPGQSGQSLAAGHRRRPGRPRAGAARARPADRAAGAARSGRGDRRRPRSRRRPGAHRALRAGSARVRGDAVEAAALADRRAAEPARGRRDRRRDRRPGRRGVVREAAQDGRASARRRDLPPCRRRHRGARRQGRPRRRRAGDREGAARRRRRTGRADGDAGRPHRRGRADDGRGAGDGDRAPPRAPTRRSTPGRPTGSRTSSSAPRCSTARSSRPAPRSPSTTASASARSSAASGRRR